MQDSDKRIRQRLIHAMFIASAGVVGVLIGVLPNWHYGLLGFVVLEVLVFLVDTLLVFMLPEIREKLFRRRD